MKRDPRAKRLDELCAEIASLLLDGEQITIRPSAGWALIITERSVRKSHNVKVAGAKR